MALLPISLAKEDRVWITEGLEFFSGRIWVNNVKATNPATTVVVIHEVATDNWGSGGDTVTVRRLRER